MQRTLINLQKRNRVITLKERLAFFNRISDEFLHRSIQWIKNEFTTLHQNQVAIKEVITGEYYVKLLDPFNDDWEKKLFN